MNLIAAVDKNWAIGRNNKLLVSIPDDMKFFRETTTGKVVVMGRKTDSAEKTSARAHAPGCFSVPAVCGWKSV